MCSWCTLLLCDKNNHIFFKAQSVSCGTWALLLLTFTFFRNDFLFSYFDFDWNLNIFHVSFLYWKFEIAHAMIRTECFHSHPFWLCQYFTVIFSYLIVRICGFEASHTYTFLQSMTSIYLFKLESILRILN